MPGVRNLERLVVYIERGQLRRLEHQAHTRRESVSRLVRQALALWEEAERVRNHWQWTGTKGGENASRHTSGDAPRPRRKIGLDRP